MIPWRVDSSSGDAIYQWLVEHQQEIRDEVAELEGRPITDSTRLYRFEYVISLFAVSMKFTTHYHLPHAGNRYLETAHWKYNFISMLFGWWCFPWGPFFTVQALFGNSNGSNSRTVGSILQEIETGWKAPDNASVSANRRRVLEVTPETLAEIRQRMEAGNYSHEVAVRVAPTKWADDEVKISFDFPVSDGNDWVDEVDDLLFLIDKRDLPQLDGTRLTFDEDGFHARPVDDVRQ